MEEAITLNPNTIHFISKGDCGGRKNVNFKFIKDNFKNNNNIIIYNHNILRGGHVPKIIKNNELIVSKSTITTGMHLAAYMGAKNIILIGHDGGLINGECNFKGYHTDKTYKIAHARGEEGYINWLKKISIQSTIIKKMLIKKYNCNILSINPFINFNLEGNKFSLTSPSPPKTPTKINNNIFKF